MPPEKPISLSASTLEVLLDCPRCFWLEQNGLRRRPRGIRATLPSGMDLVLKRYFDQYRGSLPPELKGHVEGRLIDDQSLLDAWRDRGRGLAYQDPFLGARLKGLLDDCVVQGGAYIPLDYKTKGFAPREDAHKWNQHQLDIYTLLLEANGYRTAGHGYLVFYHPLSAHEGGRVQFAITPRKVPTDRAAALRLFEEAVGLIRGPEPAMRTGCEYCLLENIRTLV